MLTELRFDDLDLREEPARDQIDPIAVQVPTNPAHTVLCTTTLLCTHLCCTTPG